MRPVKYRSANRAKVRDAKRLWYTNHKEKRRIYWSRYYATHREAIAKYRAAEKTTVEGKARNILAGAVRRGRIIKPSCCSACGREAEKRSLHGHHEDYTKPLDVQWLCAECHGLLRRTGVTH